MPATLADIQAKYGDSVYPLYKDEMHAPYMEKINGLGYQGVILYDENEDKVQCSECGKWFENLSSHIRKGHKIEVSEYREKSGLNKGTPLVIPSISKQISERMVANNNANGKRFTKNLKRPNSIKMPVGRKIPQHNNKYGLCEAQIAARLQICKDMAKENILTSKMVVTFDKKLYDCLRERFGTVEKACSHYGIKPSGKNCKRYFDSEIIAKLRAFVIENHKLPTSVNYTNSVATARRHFGSWRRAKMMAGLDQLLQEIK